MPTHGLTFSTFSIYHSLFISSPSCVLFLYLFLYQKLDDIYQNVAAEGRSITLTDLVQENTHSLWMGSGFD